MHALQVLRNVASVLKQGMGRVLFRDYAEGDMAQTRLQDSTSGARHIRGNFFARGDGTCCYYFAQVSTASRLQYSRHWVSTEPSEGDTGVLLARPTPCRC